MGVKSLLAEKRIRANDHCFRFDFHNIEESLGSHRTLALCAEPTFRDLSVDIRLLCGLHTDAWTRISTRSRRSASKILARIINNSSRYISGTCAHHASYLTTKFQTPLAIPKLTEHACLDRWYHRLCRDPMCKVRFCIWHGSSGPSSEHQQPSRGCTKQTRRLRDDVKSL